ncbi:hypothetical protein MchiMG62_18050 [Methanoculleus chikugoensis]|uniref:Uncharacterized protein n=1 Tax=Methanoculleus chikugoensis TaxID=118126 RepID=A0ABM7H787_9EURY|nr:hypothetical protein MchiMG62_18050 [Methanoculleus chikugoensis]
MRDIPGSRRWRWLGAGLRRRKGFRPSTCKSFPGGAVVGLPMNGLDLSYRENVTLRLNYFIGYMLPDRYFEIDRGKKRS